MATDTAAWLQGQNSELAIAYHAASDTYWWDVQRLRSAQLAVVVLLPAASAIVAQFFASTVTVIDFLALSLTVVDASVIYPLIANVRLKAALAQDFFDALAYRLPQSIAHHSGDTDTLRVRIAAERQPAKRAARNRDWYSPRIGDLPLFVGRIACMRESLEWDGGLRSQYVVALVLALSLAIIAILGSAVFLRLTATDLLVKLLYPILPAVVWFGREIFDNRTSVDRADALRRALDDIWKRSLRCEIHLSELDSIALIYQVRIFAYREHTAPVPEFFYVVRRSMTTSAAQSAAVDAVNEYNESSLSESVSYSIK